MNCAKYKRPTKGSLNSQEKAFINCWGKDVESGMTDLVTLMDTSGSMGYWGFRATKKIISAMLSQVRVSKRFARVALGTFATNHRINFNYILHPQDDYHKCQFKKDLQRVPFNGGLTNLKGGLRDAINIFKQLKGNRNERLDATKVVLLIADGYGNMVGNRVDWRRGSDARQEAKELRALGVKVYTIGVTPFADTRTLRDVLASDKSKYLYVPSFSSLSSLAINIRGGNEDNSDLTISDR